VLTSILAVDASYWWEGACGSSAGSFFFDFLLATTSKPTLGRI
jgi:hypothetical protein